MIMFGVRIADQQGQECVIGVICHDS